MRAAMALPPIPNLPTPNPPLMVYSCILVGRFAVAAAYSHGSRRDRPRLLCTLINQFTMAGFAYTASNHMSDHNFAAGNVMLVGLSRLKKLGHDCGCLRISPRQQRKLV